MGNRQRCLGARSALGHRIPQPPSPPGFGADQAHVAFRVWFNPPLFCGPASRRPVFLTSECVGWRRESARLKAESVPAESVVRLAGMRTAIPVILALPLPR